MEKDRLDGQMEAEAQKLRKHIGNFCVMRQARSKRSWRWKGKYDQRERHFKKSVQMNHFQLEKEKRKEKPSRKNSRPNKGEAKMQCVRR